MNVTGGVRKPSGLRTAPLANGMFPTNSSESSPPGTVSLSHQMHSKRASGAWLQFVAPLLPVGFLRQGL